jgi:hypothetical protein
MMGGALGLMTSRAMDSSSDRRKARRKLYSIVVLVRDLREELESFADTIGQLEKFTAVTESGVAFTSRQAADVIVGAERIYFRAEDVPDFDELVESEKDARVAVRCRGAFLYCRDVYKVPEWAEMKREERQRRAARLVISHKPDLVIERLRDIESNLRSRIEQG